MQTFNQLLDQLGINEPADNAHKMGLNMLEDILMSDDEDVSLEQAEDDLRGLV